MASYSYSVVRAPRGNCSQRADGIRERMVHFTFYEGVSRVLTYSRLRTALPNL